MKTKNIPYSREELAWIKRTRRIPRRRQTELFRARFGRPEITVDNIKALCTRKGWATGRSGRFVKGQASWNVGKKMTFNENSAQTQFKPGHLPKNTKYLGHERITKDGYIEISVNQVNPHTGFERRYVLKHKYLWEKEHGPVPAGKCLLAKDGDRTNTDPENWLLIPRGLLPLMNGFRGKNYQSAPPELRPSILTLAKLRYVRGCLSKNKRNCLTKAIC
jgi:hypothetical protein